MHIYQGTTPYYDEGLARSAELGAIAHRAIAELALRGRTPTLAEQTEVIVRQWSPAEWCTTDLSERVPAT